jgi:hypothetical protein
MYTLIIDEIAYTLPLGVFNNYVITASNIQRLPNINVIIDGLGFNIDPALAHIELKGLVRELIKSNQKVTHRRLYNSSKS